MIQNIFGDISFWEVIRLLIPLIFLQLTLFIVAVISLVRAERTRYLPIWGWGVVITFFSIIGPVFYLTIGRVKEV